VSLGRRTNAWAVRPQAQCRRHGDSAGRMQHAVKLTGGSACRSHSSWGPWAARVQGRGVAGSAAASRFKQESKEQNPRHHCRAHPPTPHPHPHSPTPQPPQRTSIFQVAQIFWHLYRSPTDEKNSSSVIACRRAALWPCSDRPSWCWRLSAAGLRMGAILACVWTRAYAAAGMYNVEDDAEARRHDRMKSWRLE